MLIAALISLLCFVVQSGHLHSLSLSVSSKYGIYKNLPVTPNTVAQCINIQACSKYRF